MPLLTDVNPDTLTPEQASLFAVYKVEKTKELETREACAAAKRTWFAQMIASAKAAHTLEDALRSNAPKKPRKRKTDDK
jgi:hypothetical protein